MFESGAVAVLCKSTTSLTWVVFRHIHLYELSFAGGEVTTGD